MRAEQDLRGPQAPDEKVLHEGFRLGQREIARERNHEETIDANRLDRFLLLRQSLDHPRRQFRMKDLEGVRIERDRDGGTALLRSPAHDRRENLLMAEVDPVEVSDRD